MMMLTVLYYPILLSYTVNNI